MEKERRAFVGELASSLPGKRHPVTVCLPNLPDVRYCEVPGEGLAVGSTGRGFPQASAAAAASLTGNSASISRPDSLRCPKDFFPLSLCPSFSFAPLSFLLVSVRVPKAGLPGS